MAFKQIKQPSVAPDSPEKLLLDLPRRKILDVLQHQADVMRTYATTAVEDPDVALQLPTGSGKTLVGLLIAEWRRRKKQERIVYLCPTVQLVNQATEQAEEKYGLSVTSFTGQKKHYSPEAKASYQNAERIAITTYSSLFNSAPFFDRPDVILLDDAHAAENYVASMWSLRVERARSAHRSLHEALRAALNPFLSSVDRARLAGGNDRPADWAWTDKLPSPAFDSVRDEIATILEAHADDAGLHFQWDAVKDHLDACHLYVSTQDVLIRPLLPPTWTHEPFAGARQRIYMSATLGGGGDLERLAGRRAIKRIAIPDEWNRHGVGRRFFIFPGMSLTDAETLELRHDLMRAAGRSLVLVPSDKAAANIVADVESTLKFKTFDAEGIEASKKPFVAEQRAVAIVANRYDGIDFPDDECRLMFIEGLPRAVNTQERFLMSRMGANVIFNERIQTRVLQAIGRCTRSLKDYSAVVVTGSDLPDYLADGGRRKYLHPELQAELKFGLDQSIKTALEDIVENFRIFLANGHEWEEVNRTIVSARDAAKQEQFPALVELADVVGREVRYQELMWQSDFESAMEEAQRVLGGLKSPQVQGYRALWHYLAGSAAWLEGSRSGNAAYTTKAREQFAARKPPLAASRGLFGSLDTSRTTKQRWMTITF